jgi:ABC-type sulfate transport system permease subunit
MEFAMYCYKCGLKIDERALECEHCSANTAHVMIPRFYKAGVVLGLCSLFPVITMVSAFIAGLLGSVGFYFIIIFGVAGLFFALKSKRRFAIVLNIAGIIVWILFVITPLFAVDDVHNEQYQDRKAVSEALENFIK